MAFWQTEKPSSPVAREHWAKKSLANCQHPYIMSVATTLAPFTPSQTLSRLDCTASIVLHARFVRVRSRFGKQENLPWHFSPTRNGMPTRPIELGSGL